VYGNVGVSKAMVLAWHQKFHSGWQEMNGWGGTARTGPHHHNTQECCEIEEAHYVFGPLEKVLKGCTFGSDKDVKTTVVQRIQQPREFFVEWIHQLVHQWYACLNSRGTIFNGLYLFEQNNPQMDFMWKSLIASTDVNFVWKVLFLLSIIQPTANKSDNSKRL
jgi:hypothetical protein